MMINLERYELACDNYEGWCIHCQKFTRAETEPDARDYKCPECGKNKVMGAEEAVVAGEIIIVEGIDEKEMK